ncbi:MAG: Ni/Fe hydrogenase subunit alpha [Proteobacteria bacterium]|nr:Ni/Fe hydrogenase subunit alpha [Pseudomonadota bacterium]
MPQMISIHPVTRIEGQARIDIQLDEAGQVADTRLLIDALRGFEQFVIGRPAEEIPRIVSRICGICPWMHHLAAAKAIDGCFGVVPPPTGHLLRELCHLLAHIHDKILHFFFLAAPDFIFGPNSDYSVRNIMGLVQREPELAAEVVRMRQLSLAMLARIAGKATHPVAAVVGGFAKPLAERELPHMLADGRILLDFACRALDHAKQKIFIRFADEEAALGAITTGFLGTIDGLGNLRLFEGRLRLMRPDGSVSDFAAADYDGYLAERAEPWSTAKMVYARTWDEGFSLDIEAPRGVYQVNTLARINVCDRIATPLAQAELEAFRARFGRPAHGMLLAHWARLIELVYVCERVLELLADKRITEPMVCSPAEPRAGRGVGQVEAPRGTLIHDFTTDDNGCIVRAKLIVGTTHNIAPMNMSVRQAATTLIAKGQVDASLLNRIEMAVRAYDP